MKGAWPLSVSFGKRGHGLSLSVSVKEVWPPSVGYGEGGVASACFCWVFFVVVYKDIYLEGFNKPISLTSLVH